MQLIHFNQKYLMQVNISSHQPPLNQEQVLHEYHDCQSSARKPQAVPVPVKDELRCKINELFVAKVTKRTSWISNMDVVRKPNKLRLCLDPLRLNKGIIRNHYPSKTKPTLPKPRSCQGWIPTSHS